MKKVIYTIGFLLAAGTFAQAQTLVKQSGTELADFTLLNNDQVLYTKKEAQGQFIYSEMRGNAASAQKVVTLNAGVINAVIGQSTATGEVFVYQKNGRNEEIISFYTVKDGGFEKAGERVLPKLKNHSYNLGLFLSEDKNTLLISAELSKSRGYDDLYLSKWENGKWTKPKNLGKSVNTRQPEFAPFMANDSIYFSRKEAEAAYVYGAPFGNQNAGAPAKLASAVNAADAYNAYFKKQGDQVTWISSTKGNGDAHTAYLLEKEKPVVQQVVEEPVVVEEVAAPAPVVAVKKKAEVASLILYNGFNTIHLGLEEISALNRFLKQQPVGTALVIKGYSDGFGTPEAKDYVSRYRAVSVQNYINKYFADKQFKLQLENEVSTAKGKAHRKTELYLMQ